MTTPRTFSPLEVPELLIVIFTCLGPHCLRVHASLVCRLWYKVAVPILRSRPLVWYEPRTDIKTQGALRRRLQETKTLIIKKPGRLGSYTNMPMIREHTPSWVQLTKQLDTLSEGRQLQITELTILQSLESDTLVLPILAMVGPQLTRLRLENLSQASDAPLDKILMLCPRLTVLRMHYTQLGYYHDHYRDQLQPSQQLILPSRLELRSLSLESIGIEERSLVRLLKSCCNLEELRLIRLLQRWPTDRSLIPTGATNESLVSFSKQVFLEQISQLCPLLKSIHFSDVDPLWNIRTTNATSQTLRLFPNVTSWSVLSSGTGVVLLKEFRAYHQDTLTTIEILHTKLLRDRTGSLLHQYLCESPHLLHLKADGVRFPIIWFDLEGILDARGEYHHKTSPYRENYGIIRVIASFIEPFHRKIWACRNLRTLHLQFDTKHGDNVSGERSRVLFGYLSRVCPRLQDLAIKHHKLRLDLEGGFCLLTRLRELRRLSITLGDRHREYIKCMDWMSRSMTRLQRLMIATKIEMGSFLNGRKTMYAKSPFSSTKALPPPFIKIWEKETGMSYVHDVVSDRYDNIQITTGYRGTDGDGDQENDSDSDLDYMIDGVDMRHVGRWKDIAGLFEDRFSRNWTCWPLLEYIELKATDKGQIELDKVKPMIRCLRRDVEVV